MAILPSWLDPNVFLANAGPAAVAIMMAILFAECGLLIGFFLPGDTMLFIGGLLVGSGALHINIFLLILLLWAAAFAGNMVGYWIGYKVGPAVFSRPDAKLLKPEYIQRSTEFFAKYGPIAVVLARFVPIVRTVATVMAGASRMSLRVYTLYSALGGLLWVGLVTLAGRLLGNVPLIRDHVDLIFLGAVVLVILLAAIPALLHLRQRGKSPSPDSSGQQPG